MDEESKNTEENKVNQKSNKPDLSLYLSKEEIAKLTPEQQAEYFAKQMLENLNSGSRSN